MPDRIRVRDTRTGRVHVFPAGTTPEQIQQALQLPAAAPVGRSGGAGPRGAGGGAPRGPVPGGTPGVIAEAPRLMDDPLGYAGATLRNVPASAGRLVKDVVTGIPAVAALPYQMAEQADAAVAALGEDAGAWERVRTGFGSMGRQAAAVPGVIVEALSERYGSPAALERTVREDPAGVLADITAVAGGGAALAGTRAPRVASTLGAVAQADPIALGARTVAAGANAARDTVTRSVIRPSASLRQDAGGARGVAEAIGEQGVVTSDQARRRMQRVGDELDAALGDRTIETGWLLDPSDPQLVRSQARLDARARIGDAAAPEAYGQRLRAAREALEQSETLPARDVNAMKREAQHMAYDRASTSIDTPEMLASRDLARILREQLDLEIPGVRGPNRDLQQLGWVKDALAAEDRGRGLLGTAGVVSGAALGLTGKPAAGIGTALLMAALESPMVGAALTTGLHRGGRIAGSPITQRAAIVSRLAAEYGLDEAAIEALLANEERRINQSLAPE